MVEQAPIQFRADKVLKQPENTISRAEAKNAFHTLRRQAADVPEMSLEEINAEITAARTGKGRCSAYRNRQEDK